MMSKPQLREVVDELYLLLLQPDATRYAPPTTASALLVHIACSARCAHLQLHPTDVELACVHRCRAQVDKAGQEPGTNGFAAQRPRAAHLALPRRLRSHGPLEVCARAWPQPPRYTHQVRPTHAILTLHHPRPLFRCWNQRRREGEGSQRPEAQLERVARGRSLAPSRRLSSALARVDGGGWWSYVQGFSDICAGGTARVSNRMICAPLSALGECTEARERSERGEHSAVRAKKNRKNKVITVRIVSLTFRVSRERRDD